MSMRLWKMHWAGNDFIFFRQKLEC